MPAACAAAELMFAFRTAGPSVCKYLGSTWLIFNRALCRWLPAWPLYDRSSTIDPVSWRWIEKFQLLYSGIRAASSFWNHGMARPFEPEALMKGGSGKDGKLPLSKNAGETPLSCVLKLGFVEKP